MHGRAQEFPRRIRLPLLRSLRPPLLHPPHKSGALPRSPSPSSPCPRTLEEKGKLAVAMFLSTGSNTHPEKEKRISDPSQCLSFGKCLGSEEPAFSGQKRVHVAAFPRLPPWLPAGGLDLRGRWASKRPVKKPCQSDLRSCGQRKTYIGLYRVVTSEMLYCN